MERYNFKDIDSKWQKIWDEKNIYKSETQKKDKEEFMKNRKPINRDRDGQD